MKNDLYPLDQSALFKLRSRKKLAERLGVTFEEFKSLLREHNNYQEFMSDNNQIIEHPLFKRKPRSIQNPNRVLKTVQRRILRLLQKIFIPDYLFSAVKGRSYIDNANRHKDSAVTFCVDIKDFYRNTTFKQTRSFFLDTMKCSPDVSFLLASLICYNDKESKTAYLPTGGPLSPIISFWVNSMMFEQLYDFAVSHDLTMTVYVDDITFSGEKITKQMQSKIKSIIITNHYTAHKLKYYDARAWKIITGGKVKNGVITAPNKLKAKARIARDRYIKHPSKREQLGKTLNGLASAIGQFEPNDQIAVLNSIR